MKELFGRGTSLREWLPEGHLSHFISETIDSLDVGEFYEKYEGDGRRKSPYERKRRTGSVFPYGAEFCSEDLADSHSTSFFQLTGISLSTSAAG